MTQRHRRLSSRSQQVLQSGALSLVSADTRKAAGKFDQPPGEHDGEIAGRGRASGLAGQAREPAFVLVHALQTATARQLAARLTHASSIGLGQRPRHQTASQLQQPRATGAMQVAQQSPVNLAPQFDVRRRQFQSGQRPEQPALEAAVMREHVEIPT